MSCEPAFDKGVVRDAAAVVAVVVAVAWCGVGCTVRAYIYVYTKQGKMFQYIQSPIICVTLPRNIFASLCTYI